ncbi:hypothetical protein H8K12_13385 [Clostridium perfringens]|nr:hypothetical protein [Clostridium perfringens]MBI6060834.1 hypothetical protein [Clostridium perfringens]MBI6106036.1 hypothetical protein [Clostridium perfringens]
MGKIINSRYNLDFEKSEYYILYNLFTKKSIRFNKDKKDLIKSILKNPQDFINYDYTKYLIREGFLLDICEQKNQLEALKAKHN